MESGVYLVQCDLGMTVPNSGVLVGNARFLAVFVMRWWRIVPWLYTHGCYTVEIGLR